MYICECCNQLILKLIICTNFSVENVKGHEMNVFLGFFSNKRTHWSKSLKVGSISICFSWTCLRRFSIVFSYKTLCSSDAWLQLTLPGFGCIKLSNGGTSSIGFFSKLNWVKTVNRNRSQRYINQVENSNECWRSHEICKTWFLYFNQILVSF